MATTTIDVKNNWHLARDLEIDLGYVQEEIEQEGISVGHEPTFIENYVVVPHPRLDNETMPAFNIRRANFPPMPGEFFEDYGFVGLWTRIVSQEAATLALKMGYGAFIVMDDDSNWIHAFDISRLPGRETPKEITSCNHDNLARYVIKSVRINDRGDRRYAFTLHHTKSDTCPDCGEIFVGHYYGPIE